MNPTLHLKKPNWPTIGFVCAAVLGVAFASIAILSDDVGSKFAWLTFIMAFAMIALRKKEKVHLPEWGRSGKAWQ